MTTEIEAWMEFGEARVLLARFNARVEAAATEMANDPDADQGDSDQDVLLVHEMDPREPDADEMAEAEDDAIEWEREHLPGAIAQGTCPYAVAYAGGWHPERYLVTRDHAHIYCPECGSLVPYSGPRRWTEVGGTPFLPSTNAIGSDLDGMTMLRRDVASLGIDKVAAGDWLRDEANWTHGATITIDGVRYGEVVYGWVATPGKGI